MVPENQKFLKIKKTREDIIILQMCTINDSHMMYGSWNIECNGQKFLLFCPFTSLTIRKIKILKKWKKPPGDIIILHMCTKTDNHMMYGSWDIERDRQNSLSFGPFFAVLPP